MRACVAAAVVGLTIVLAACDRAGEEAPVPSAPPPTFAPATTSVAELPACDDDLVDDVVELLQDQLDALAESEVADVGADADLAARQAGLAARATEDECRPADLIALVRLGAIDLEAEGVAAER